MKTERVGLAVFPRHQAYLRELPQGTFWGSPVSEPGNVADRDAVLMHVWEPVGYLPRYWASTAGPVVDLLAGAGILLELRTIVKGKRHDSTVTVDVPQPDLLRRWTRELSRGEFPSGLYRR